MPPTRHVLGYRINPRWENAQWEVMDSDDPGGDPFPYRYEDRKAAAKHVRTKTRQPSAVPIFLVTWSDGTETESEWEP